MKGITSAVLGMWLTGVSGVATAKTVHVLPPHAAGPMSKLVAVGTPLVVSDGVSLMVRASIERDRVVVRAKDSTETVRLAVTLQHPEDAPADAQRVGQVALVVEPGPAPGPLLAALIERIEGSAVTLPWVVVEMESSKTDPVFEDKLTQIDVWIYSGELGRARQALRGIPPPDDVLELAELALRWRLAGAPARAVSLTSGAGVQHEAHEILALAVARGESVSFEAAGTMLPERGVCRASRVVALLRRDRAFDVASHLADAIRSRDPTCIDAFYQTIITLELNGQRQAAMATLAAAQSRFTNALEFDHAETFLRTRSGDHAGAWRVQVRLVIREMITGGRFSAIRVIAAWLTGRFQSAARRIAAAWTTSTTGTTPRPPAAERWCPQVEKEPQQRDLACLRRVPRGTFLMGAQSADPGGPGYDEDASADEGPTRMVTIASFYAMHTEVDVSSYTHCVKVGACRAEDALATGGYQNYGHPHRGAHSMNGVSWFGAQRYCAWIDARLPTEAEWEFLARGEDGWRFPWGNDLPDCRPTRNRLRPQGCPVDGTQAPAHQPITSAMKLAAMGSGLLEWVADWYGPYASEAPSNPTGPGEGKARVQRGGSWATEEPLEYRAAYRASMPPDSQSSDVGFRCVRSIR